MAAVISPTSEKLRVMIYDEKLTPREIAARLSDGRPDRWQDGAAEVIAERYKRIDFPS